MIAKWVLETGEWNDGGAWHVGRFPFASLDTMVQQAIRQRLITSLGVTAYVPADHILDRHSAPAPDPSIIIGMGQTIEGDDIARRKQHVFLDLHVWVKEPSLEGVKVIAGVVRNAIQGARFGEVGGVYIGDCRVSSMRFMRDDGETSHGMVTVEALAAEVTQ